MTVCQSFEPRCCSRRPIARWFGQSRFAAERLTTTLPSCETWSAVSNRPAVENGDRHRAEVVPGGVGDVERRADVGTFRHLVAAEAVVVRALVERHVLDDADRGDAGQPRSRSRKSRWKRAQLGPSTSAGCSGANWNVKTSRVS
jgi:hypothetical protein